MNLFKRYGLLSLGAAAGLMCGSCVNMNKSLGESMIPDSQMYDIYTAEFPIEDIEQEMADSLSSFSMYKFTFGAIRDEAFGLTTKRHHSHLSRSATRSISERMRNSASSICRQLQIPPLTRT